MRPLRHHVFAARGCCIVHFCNDIVTMHLFFLHKINSEKVLKTQIFSWHEKLLIQQYVWYSETLIIRTLIIQTLHLGPCIFAYINKQPWLSKLSIIQAFLLGQASLDNQGCTIFVITDCKFVSSCFRSEMLLHCALCIQLTCARRSQPQGHHQSHPQDILYQ